MAADSSIDFLHCRQSENCDLNLLISDAGGAFVLTLLIGVTEECLLAWCEAVCSFGSGERGRELISTLALLPLLPLLLPGSWIKHLFDLYQECIGQSTPVSVFLSACLSLIVPHVCTQTPPLPFPTLLHITDSPWMQWPLVMTQTKAKAFSHLHPLERHYISSYTQRYEMYLQCVCVCVNRVSNPAPPYPEKMLRQPPLSRPPQVQSADWLLLPVCRQRLMLNVTDTKSPLLSQTYLKYCNIKRKPTLHNLLWYICFLFFLFWKHWSGMKSLTSPTPAREDCDVCWHSSGNAAWVEWESNVSTLALNILLVSLI